MIKKNLILFVALLLVSEIAFVQNIRKGKYLDSNDFKHYITDFNSKDFEPYGWYYTNDSAWAFMENNIPFFECPDKNLERTYYFRWWTYRKHLRYTEDGWIMTEFASPKPWGGKHGAIVCSAGHQVYEGRWLRNPQYVRDYLEFYLKVPESRPRNYSFWQANSLIEFTNVHPDIDWEEEVLPLVVERFNEWGDHKITGNILYWQADMKDGMEFTVGGMVLNKSKLKFSVNMTRPTINSYMYGDALAISEMAKKANAYELEKEFAGKADSLKSEVISRLWNEELEFFTSMPKHYNDTTLPISVREQIGYVPWYFNLPPDEEKYAVAWEQLMDKEGFYAPFGPTTCEQRHPGFQITYIGTECQWNGPSWPFATTQTLVALANLLNNYKQDAISKSDYYETLSIYSNSHRFRQIKPELEGLDTFKIVPPTMVDTTRMWIDENLDPYNGNWLTRYQLALRKPGQDERGKDYNHSGFCDLIISGLIGIRTSVDHKLVVNPLTPDKWEYFCLDRVSFKGKEVTVLWDKTGRKYNLGKGFQIIIDGKVKHKSDLVKRVSIEFN